MRMSHLIGRRFKEKPAEATLDSHTFLLRGGYVRQVARGIFSLLPPARRITRKIETIIKEEMDLIGGQEVTLPVVLPRELWEESGRYKSVGPELVRFKDRVEHDLLLGMTHEEAVVHLARTEVSSHRQFPFMLYQIQTKFRDEPRPRGGLIRVREFVMKDAYSFHTSQADLNHYYDRCWRAYLRIFARCGLPETVAVQSDTGMMGGAVAHEFMLLCDAGEDTVVCCTSCSYLANLEVATGRVAPFPAALLPLKKVHTPGMKTIAEVARFLGVEPRQTAKVIFYQADAEGQPVMALIRGDLEINESKLAKIIRAVPVQADKERAASTGAVPGYASPLAVNKERCRMVIDHTVAAANNLVCGANEVDYHYLNFNLERDVPGIPTVDIAQIREGDLCPRCSGRLMYKRGIELGNIFQLGRKYTEAMGMRFQDEAGNSDIPIMGCYGIGVGRLLGSVIEAKHDAYGPIWPIAIAPWQVHICALNLDDPQVATVADTIYSELLAHDVEVLYDDRNERAGSQFADADLLGIPFRLIVSEKNIANGQVELKRRGERISRFVALGEVTSLLQSLIAEALAESRSCADQLAKLPLDRPEW